MKLETKRLILRLIEKKDIKDLIEGINNLKVSRYLLVVPYPYKMKDAKSWFNSCRKKAKEKPRKTYELLIELKSEKTIIGAVGLSNVDRFQGTANIGYWLSEKYWRQGIMTEAATKVIDFAFNKLKLRRLQAPVFAENKASQDLAEKLGFKKEGRMRKAVRGKATGKIHDEIMYGLLKEDWRKLKKIKDE